MIYVGKTKFYKNVDFLVPFYQAALPLMPKGKTLHSVRGIQVSLDREPGADGVCRTEDWRNYYITLNVWDRKWEKHGSMPGWWKASAHKMGGLDGVLLTFAHELAHVREWEHTPRHWEWTHKFAAKFTKVLERYEIKDSSQSRGWRKKLCQSNQN